MNNVLIKEAKKKDGATVKLKKAMNRLAEIAPAESPMLSCFVNLNESRIELVAQLEIHARELERGMTAERKQDFRDAFSEVKNFILNEVAENSAGAAIYARWGERPFLLPIEFGVEMETRLIVDDLPHIYPLVETKDVYERFVVVVMTEEYGRVLETTLGSITWEIFNKRPALRKRVGREWTREHYQNHKRDREHRFVSTKVEIVEELMRKRGHNHLVVAGSPKMVSRFTSALPKRLQEQVISTLPSTGGRRVNALVKEALDVFAEKEQQDSLNRVDALIAGVLSGGLGVAGVGPSMQALRDGYADILVISKDLDDAEMREGLVRTAVRHGIPVETVGGSDDLRRLGGVGCLLRYRPDFVNASYSSLLA